MGGLIMDMTTKQSFGFEVYEHDGGLAKAFEIAGQGRFADNQLNAIEGHKHTVYLVCGEPFASPNRESRDAARSLLQLGLLMIDAGGFAVKVESSGIAHTADRWRHYAEQRTTLALYDAFVTMVGGRGFNYTCGMHTFGLPDVSLTTGIPIDEAPYIMNGFNQYQLLESPTLSEGDLFSTSHSEPWMKMTHCLYGYHDDDLLNNPFGRWHLELSDTRPPNATKYQTGGEPLFMAMRRDDPELVASVKQARTSIDWFLSHFRSPYEYGHHHVKIHIQDGDESAYIWAALVDVNDQGMIVELFEVPHEFRNYKSGRKLRIQVDDIYDWSINRNSTLIGGFSRRLQRKHVPEEQRREFDLCSGAIAFVPTEEVLR
jgi:uncharacterized protein YegJ (DUF2314 family)